MQQELLAGKTIPMIAKGLGIDRGYFQRCLMKDEDYAQAIAEVDVQVAEMQAQLALQEFLDLKEERAEERAAAGIANSCQ